MCDKCEEVFSFEKHLNDHYNNHINVATSLTKSKDINIKVYQCNMCDENFKYSEEMEIHMESYHSECSYCSKWFQTSEEMIDNRELCNSCGDCNKIFNNTELLEKHVDEHEKLNTEIVECTVCQNTFKSNHRMYQHW